MSKLEKIILLALGAVAAVLAVVFFLPKPAPEIVVGDFTPPPFEETAVSGTPAVTSPDDYGTLRLSDEITVSLCGAPAVVDGKVQLLFASDENNTGWVRVRVYTPAGLLLGETGLLKPGEYVEFIPLSAIPEDGRIVAKILTYQPETYYSLGSAAAEITLQQN